MKKSTVLSFLLYSNFCLFSQNVPFPIDSAEWITFHVSNYCIGGSNIYHQWIEYLDGDTLLDNSTFHKLWFKPECAHSNAGEHCDEYCQPANAGPFLIGGIKEEEGKAYFLKFDVPNQIFQTYERTLSNIPVGKEILLYDSGWAVADTFSLPVNVGTRISFKVLDISMKNGRKKVHVIRTNGLGFDYNLFAGMGEETGLFGLYYSPGASTYLAQDICFYHNGELIQNCGPRCSGCDSIVIDSMVIDSVDVPVHDVISEPKIYPNPTNGIINIEFDSLKGPFLVHVYNLIGELVYTSIVEESPKVLNVHSFGLEGIIQIVLTDQNFRRKIFRVLVL